MPVKIRLARHGRKRKPFYYIVIADGRAPRDGKFIERVGSYNPNTNPATIVLDFDKSLEWLQKGAQPTDTVRRILSHEGVMFKNHLLKGVIKGAFTEEVAEEKYKDWATDKEAKNQAKEDAIKGVIDKEAKKRFAAEAKVNEERIAKFAEKQSALLAEAEAEAAEAKAAKEATEAAEEAAKEATKEEAAPVEAAPETKPTEDKAAE